MATLWLLAFLLCKLKNTVFSGPYWQKQSLKRIQDAAFNNLRPMVTRLKFLSVTPKVAKQTFCKQYSFYKEKKAFLLMVSGGPESFVVKREALLSL